MLSQARTPVEQMLRLVIPGFVGTTRRLEPPFHASVPEFLEYATRAARLRASRTKRVPSNRVFAMIDDGRLQAWSGMRNI